MLAAQLDEEAIFNATRKIDDPAARAAYLHDACPDSALRERIEALLAVHDQERSFLNPLAGAYSPTITERPVSEAPGTVIGPYKLLEQIGEGGFGVVFMAEQTHPVKRKVALKVIKPGMDTRQVIARFEAERQALALMDHPNIAKVLDAGTTGDTVDRSLRERDPISRSEMTTMSRPYFVMELVKGIPITDYCDQRRLATKERLELFVTVCQAVQHAHQKGIIHRDIKPSNVLVTLHDDKPVVKVIDFGIAKAMTGQLTDRTLFTGFAQMVGTPLYMSPEQAAISGTDVDTRSDIYSLGVLLYELLTGTTPFDKGRLQEAGYDEIRRIIQEEEPPRPSARISTLRNTDTARTAVQHRTSGNLPGPVFFGELDWIVMKALEKDRNRRYESAGALARDIERHLRDEPVQACPPSNWYRLRKFARRNRALFMTASVVAVALLTAVTTLAVSSVLVWRAKDELAQNLAREQREAYFQRITGAYRELSADNLGGALELLNACPEELRGWEWRYLMRLGRVQPLVISVDTEINGLAFSPDGTRIASAGGDRMIKIWYSRTGDVVQTLENAHSDSVVSIAFHPDGKHLASVGFDQLVKVWDLTTERELFTAPCDIGRKLGTAYTVAFSPDGRQLAASSEGSVKIWDWKDRPLSPLHTLPKHKFHSIPVAFSSDGRLATAVGERGILHLWDAETGLPLGTISAHRYPVSALAFSPDGKWLASASYDRSVKLSDSTTGAMLPPFEGHTGNVECVAFSPDGKLVASGGEDKVARVWDATTGREVLTLSGHTGRCCCVAFSPDPDGLRLASASIDGTIRIWDATPLRGDECQDLRTITHDGVVRSVAFSAVDSQRVASAGSNGSVKVWDAATGRVSAEFNGLSTVVFCLAWHPDAERIAAAGSGDDGMTVKVWDSRTGEEDFELPNKRAGPYQAVAFSPDGRYLVTGHVNGAVQVWDARTGRELSTLGTHGRAIWGLVFSGDGRHLASSSEGEVKLWDATRLDKAQENPVTLPARVPGESLNVAFSPDGRRLATGGEENTVIIRDVETGENLQTLWGKHSGEVYAVAFSHVDDGRWIATAGEDSAVKIWNSHTGELIHSFRGHEGLVSSLAFSPDGRRLISGSRDKTVKVWDLTQLSD